MVTGRASGSGEGLDNTIGADGYDRAVFDRLFETHEPLKAVHVQLQRVLPRPRALLEDLFFVLFKLSLSLRPAAEVSAAAQINRRLVRALLEAQGLPSLRQETELNPKVSALMLAPLAKRLLAALLRDFRVVDSELQQAADLGDAAEALARLRREMAHLQSLPPGALGGQEAALMAALKAEEAAHLEALEAGAKAQASVAEGLASSLDGEIQALVATLSRDLDAARKGVSQLGWASSRGSESFAWVETLIASPKLRQLARIVGPLREFASRAHPKGLKRAPIMPHQVELGRDLARVLPSELLWLHAGVPGAQRWFQLRYIEGQLMQHRLGERAGRGPLVICVDLSASMQGARELWAKALAMTLIELARRDHRSSWVIGFSASSEIFEAEIVGRRGAKRALQTEALLDFAHWFPGGATDFETPLARALLRVTEDGAPKGDIVFITDGEASVSEALLADLAQKKRRHGFKIRGVWVDLGQYREVETVLPFCDSLLRVSTLSGERLSALFQLV